METLLYLLSFLGLSLIIGVLRFFAPYKPIKGFNLYDIGEDRKKKYKKFEACAIFIVIASAIIIGFVVYYLGLQITENTSSSTYTYIQRPPVAFWGFLGVVLGIGLLRIPMTIIYKLILKDEYYIYSEYMSLKNGWDNEKIWRPFEIILGVGGMLFFLLGINWNIRVDNTNQTIEFNELFSVKAHTYSLSDISEISYYPEQKLEGDSNKIKEYYTIKMNDAYIWSSKIYGSFTDIDEDFTKLGTSIEELSKSIDLEIKRQD